MRWRFLGCDDGDDDGDGGGVDDGRLLVVVCWRILGYW